MKTEFKTKFLQHLNQKRKEGGFTLIELLVVIIIIGILAAIALPSFLNQAAKAKQSEAKSYVGAINRGQQAYRLENTGFTDKPDKLNVGLPTETKNYKYFLSLDGTTGAKAEAKPQDASLKGYAGLVKQTKVGTTGAALCESNESGLNVVPTPAVSDTDGKPTCPTGRLVGS